MGSIKVKLNPMVSIYEQLIYYVFVIKFIMMRNMCYQNHNCYVAF